MTTLRDMLASDIQETLLNTSDLAQTITYTPAGGAGVEISALLSVGRPGLGEMEDSEHGHQEMTVTIAIADVANPAEGDTLTIDTYAWSVVEVEELSATLARLRVARQARTRQAGSGRARVEVP